MNQTLVQGKPKAGGHAIAMTFWKKNHGMAVPASLRCDSWVGQCFGRRSPPKFLVCAAKNQFFFFSSSLFLSPDSHQKVVDDT